MEILQINFLKNDCTIAVVRGDNYTSPKIKIYSSDFLFAAIDFLNESLKSVNLNGSQINKIIEGFTEGSCEFL